MTTTDTVRDELRAIYTNHGTLTPALVVEQATAPDSPLHDKFEWRDDEAARKYRLVQAGRLIRSVTIARELRDYLPTHLHGVREFQSVNRAGRGREYVPTGVVVADPLALRITLRDMERDWQAFKARYEHLAEFAAFVNGKMGQAAS